MDGSGNSGQGGVRDLSVLAFVLHFDTLRGPYMLFMSPLYHSTIPAQDIGAGESGSGYQETLYLGLAICR